MLDKRDLYDFKRQYPETIDCIDDLVECGWGEFNKLRKEHREKLACALLLEDEEAAYEIPNIRGLIVDLIKSEPLGVFSFNNKVVDATLKNNKEMLERMFELVKANQKLLYIKSAAEEYRPEERI